MADNAGASVTQETIMLWPDGPPRALPPVPPESTYQAAFGVAAGTTMLRNVSEPSLTVFRPAKPNGIGVIVCPGGGWRILAWQHEGIDLAHWLAARGYTTFLLKYRLTGTPADPAEFMAGLAATDARVAAPVPAARAPSNIDTVVRNDAMRFARDVAADDGRRALELVRERASEWGIQADRVGLIGFSAGAFLVADVAMNPGGPPPAFVAPIYGGETRGAPVPADASPLFTVVALDDRLMFKIVAGLYADWSNADRPSALHVFTKGAHGFGMVRQGLECDLWPDLFAAWLKDQGLA